MNTPKLRFKEFTDEWKENKLHDIAKITMGQSPNSENYTYDSSDTLLIQGNADLYNGKVIPRLFTKQITKTCDKEDIIMTVRAPVGDIAISDYYACIGRGVCSIKSSKFIYHYLDYLKEKGYWKKISKGSTIDSITSDNIKSLIIKTPSKKEQEKIIRTIDLINKKIELQTRKIKALKLFKKGLFDIQLKINGKESIMFDDFLDEVTKKSSIQNQYPVLSSTSKGLFLQSDYFNKQASCENNVGYKILKRNQLVLSPQNLWMGNININNIFDIGIVSPSYRVYNIDIKKMDLNYFNYWIKTPKALYSYLISSEQGASIVRRNLNIEMFNQISLKIPNLEKQHIIGNRIYQFDLKINLEEEKLKLLYKLKKGLMQKMFI